MKHLKRKRGAQPGNQNARKHGFYSVNMSLQEINEFWQALNLESADPEIAALRVKLSSALRSAPDNPRVLAEASRLLAKWYRSKYCLVGQDNTEFKKLVRLFVSQINNKISGTNRSYPPEIPVKITERIEAETPFDFLISATK
jgi:hypothetical protein